MMAKLAGWLLLVGAVVFTGIVHAQIEPRTRVTQGEAYVPTPSTAKVAALGFDAVMADYYWLQAIQAAGGHVVVDDVLGRHLGKLIDVVTTLDPWVDHPYRFAAIWMTEGVENVRTANRLLERGIEHHPDEWRNWFYLGFNRFYFLGENEAAADALEQATRLPGSPAYLPRLVARLRSSTADIDVAAVFLRQLHESTEDEARRAGYQSALDEIEVEQKARFLDRAREAHRKLAGYDVALLEELTAEPHRVIDRLPRPFPDALPPAAAPEAKWVIGDDGRTVSTYYGARYEIHYSSAHGGILDENGELPQQSEADDASDETAGAAATREGADEDV